eukprot:scaffold31872_cov76-Attheya_sp.AAC.2
MKSENTAYLMTSRTTLTSKLLSGNMNKELDIDFRFDGPTDSFEEGNTVATGLGTGLGTAYIFEVLIKKALLRSKRDNVGNELEEGRLSTLQIKSLSICTRFFLRNCLMR